MSALSAAAQDEDGDIIKTLQARVADLEAQLYAVGAGGVGSPVARQDHPEQHLDMVPEGWKLVPVEPTDEMVEAGDHEIEKWGVDASSSGAFRAMLAAAPQPPVVEQPHVGKEPDWKDLYQKEKRRAEMWIAKYEKYIGKLQVTVPVAARPPSVAARTCANCLHNKPPFGNCDGCSQQNDDADDEGNWEPIPEPQGDQEPVAWIFDVDDHDEPHVSLYSPLGAPNVSGITPLYNHTQPHRQPLTEEQIFDLAEQIGEIVALKEQRDELLETLHTIERWSSHASDFAADYGATGVRDLYRSIARAAIDKAGGAK